MIITCIKTLKKYVPCISAEIVMKYLYSKLATTNFFKNVRVSCYVLGLHTSFHTPMKHSAVCLCALCSLFGKIKYIACRRDCCLSE